MLVVADTTPINNLILIDAAFVLPALFQRVLIPPIVESELRHARTPRVVQAFMEARPDWLGVESPQTPRPIPPLDPGEEQAICLAADVRADAVLIDELQGRKAARRWGLRVIGTVGVLELAAVERLIDLPLVAPKLLATNFHVDPQIVQGALDRDAQRRKGR